jgi:protein-S-isoprenylcysteine O-methyltransferase Ste14
VSVRVRTLIASPVSAGALVALLLASAGTTDWPAAWAFGALFVVVGVVGALVAPEAVLRERLRGPIRSGQAAADRVWVPAMGALLLGWFVLMAVDARRYGWTTLPPVLHVLGAALFAGANGFGLWVICANPFASASVRVDEAQRVATDGPYRVVRHPMYTSVLLFVPGAALLLGSLWGAAATLLIVVALAVRIGIEERTLRAELPGYAEYAAAVRWRLVPGVW